MQRPRTPMRISPCQMRIQRLRPRPSAALAISFKTEPCRSDLGGVPPRALPATALFRSSCLRGDSSSKVGPMAQWGPMGGSAPGGRATGGRPPGGVGAGDGAPDGGAPKVPRTGPLPVAVLGVRRRLARALTPRGLTVGLTVAMLWKATPRRCQTPHQLWRRRISRQPLRRPRARGYV